MELGAKPCPQEQSRDHLHHHPGLCQDLSYPKVIREPPNRCPQQLRSSPCLRAGAPHPWGSLCPPKAREDQQVGFRGGSTAKPLELWGSSWWDHGTGTDPRWQRGTDGLLRSGTFPITGSKDKHPRAPGTSRAASPGPFLPPESGAVPVLPPSLCHQMPGSTPRPPPASPTPQNPHGQYLMHHALVPGGMPSSPPDQALWPQSIFILSSGRAQSSAIQGAISRPGEVICPQGAIFQVAQVDGSDPGGGGIVTSMEQPAHLTSPARRCGHPARLLRTPCDVCSLIPSPCFSTRPEFSTW